MNLHLAGGALMDAGWYPVSLVRMVAGSGRARPRDGAVGPSGVDLDDAGDDRVPEWNAGADLVHVRDGAPSTCVHRRRRGLASQTTYFNDTSATAFLRCSKCRRGTGWDAQREVVETAATSGFLAEAEAFHDLVRGGWAAWTGATPEESIDIALTLDALAASARSGDAIDIAPPLERP